MNFRVLDLYSGCGGMSYGFHQNQMFSLVGAVDRQNGKPSSGIGTLECNKSYEKNIGIRPYEADLSDVSGKEIAKYINRTSGQECIDVLISCAPCTGFSKTVRKNLITDDVRNSLVANTSNYVRYFNPKLVVMENVGELLKGKFRYHFETLENDLTSLGYEVSSQVHDLSEYGLAQSRKRSLIVACRSDVGRLRTLTDLWSGFKVRPEATTVRRAIGSLPNVVPGASNDQDINHVCPKNSDLGLRRLEATPEDGGDWSAWVGEKDADDLLIPSMKRQLDNGRIGPYRDVYGRLWWDRPAITIKRECSHTGNGRYAHPKEHRLCTVRELALMQGFPADYIFVAKNFSNMYRHIGDSVPPLISFQLSKLCEWILTGQKPNIEDCVLPKTTLKVDDIIKDTVQLEISDL